MNNFQIEFINYLADFLNKRESRQCDNIDSTIVELANNHSVQGIIYNQSKCIAFRDFYYLFAITYLKRLRLESEILKKLRDEGIESIFVKGDCISAFYPTPALRTMGDIDLIVQAEDKKKACEVLIQIGCIPIEGKCSESVKAEWVFVKNGVTIELHHALLYGNEAGEVVNDYYLEFFSQIWNYVNEDKLDWNFHFLYLVVHMRKHFLNSGIGIRQFMDLVVVVHNCQLDWEWITLNLKKMKLYDFCEICFSLSERWFGIKMPFSIDLDDSFFEFATDKILANGVFGYASNANYANRLTNLNNSKKNRVKYVLSKVFIPYEQYVYREKYAFVKSKKFLLPIAWILHMKSGILRIKHEEDYWGNILPDKERIQERIQEIRLWGL